VFLEGIERKYPSELIRDSYIIEGNIIACLWKEPTLYEDWKIEHNDFITEDGAIYFKLGQELYLSGYRVFDIMSVLTYLSDKDDLKKWFEEHGGYKSIEELVVLINLENADKIYDDLNKRNILLSLHDKGFQVVSNLEKFEKFTSELVYQFYDLQLNNIFVKKQLGVKVEDLLIDDAFIDKCNDGDEMGFNYGKHCPILSYTTCGVHRKNLYILAGHSGTGKTSFACANYILPLLEQNEKVCIISNEQNINEYKRLLLGTVISNEVGYYDMTRKDLQRGGFKQNELHWDAVQKGKDFINNYKGNLKFVKLYDYDTSSVKKIVNTLSKQGFGIFLYDTFKADDLSSNTVVGDLVEDSKRLFRIADKEDVAIIMTMQLALWTLDKRYLNASCLSTAKGVKEVCSELILMRSMWDDEYKGETKDIKPYKIIQGTSSKQEIELNKNKKHMIIFIDKTRSGATDIQLIYQSDLQFNKWRELGWCTSHRL
jgi:replicative DNA helicase